MGTKNTSMKTSFKERLAFSLGNVGGGILYTVSGACLTMYYTDSVLMSAGFVGLMMLVMRVFDGVSDLIMGTVMESVHFKSGKAKPWFGISFIPIALCFWMMYRVPASMSTGMKMVYICITYFLFNVVFYTMNNLAYWAMLPRIAPDSADRNTTCTFSTVFSQILSTPISMALIPALNAAGGIGEPRAWLTVISVVCGISVIASALCYFGVREKISVEEETAQKLENQVGNKEALLHLLKTRYFYFAAIMFVVNQSSNVFIVSGLLYYIRDVMDAMQYYSLMALVVTPAGIIAMLFVPKMFASWGKRKTFTFLSLLQIAGGCLTLVAPANLVIVTIGSAVRMMGALAYGSGIFTLAGDVAEYIHMNIGVRVEGMATAANSFGMKVGLGLGSAVMGMLLQISGYNGALEVQPHSAIIAEIAIFVIIPTLTEVIRLIVARFWDLDEKLAEVKYE